MARDSTTNRFDSGLASEGRPDPLRASREELLAQLRADLEHERAIRGTSADPLHRAQQTIARLRAMGF